MTYKILVLTITFLLSFVNLFAQIPIKGKVLHGKLPVEKATIFLNNTIKGTITDKNGEFTLNVKQGFHQLIISHLGFKTIKYDLNTSEYKKNIEFHLEKDYIAIQEVVIKPKKHDKNWEYKLARFKQEFIGTSSLSKYCEIKNPEVLHFVFDAEQGTLSANAHDALHIRNNALGYDIDFILKYFITGNNKTTYLGYSHFKELKGSRRKQKKWKKNRLKAYNGSRIHFLKSIMKNTAKEEGFVIHQFERKKNEQRPSKEEVQKARKILSLHSGKIEFTKKIDNPHSAYDSALIVLKKYKLPKYVDYLYKSDIKDSCIIAVRNNNIFLEFENNLKIVYLKEKEEQAYILRGMFSKPRKAVAQSSNIIPLEKSTIIYKTGILSKPLNVLYEGYWSFEKFAQSLPLDYIPPKK